MATLHKAQQRAALRRRRRVRGKVSGTAERPRLTVCKTLKHIHAQVIDDASGVTLVGVSSNSKLMAGSDKKSKTELAAEVGKAIASQAKDKGITEVVFDRNTNRYHGRVKALAEAARETGLKF